jgi:hypothetical protein
MSAHVKLLQQALLLDEKERAALALELMDSVSAPDPRDETAWIAEIERRAQRALAGASPSVEVGEALDRISRDLGS